MRIIPTTPLRISSIVNHHQEDICILGIHKGQQNCKPLSMHRENAQNNKNKSMKTKRCKEQHYEYKNKVYSTRPKVNKRGKGCKRPKSRYVDKYEEINSSVCK